MFARLKGKVIDKQDNHLILDVNGVGYLVYITLNNLNKITIEEDIILYIQTIVKEDEISLIGFKNNNDKQIFNLLITVQGVGVKLALAIMSQLEIIKIEQALISEDVETFKKISGVGAKVAQRLITELKDKIIKLNLNNININNIQLTQVVNDKIIVQEVITALTQLGYSSIQVKNVINIVQKDILPSTTTEELLKLVLNQIAKQLN